MRSTPCASCSLHVFVACLIICFESLYYKAVYFYLALNCAQYIYATATYHAATRVNCASIIKKIILHSPVLEFHEANVFILLPAVFFFNFFKIFFQSLTKTFLKWKTKIWLLHRPLFRLCLFETRSDLSKWTRSASLPSVSAPFLSRLTPVNYDL